VGKEEATRSLRVSLQALSIANFYSTLRTFNSDSFYRFMGDMSEDQEKALQEFKKYLAETGIADHP